MQANRGELKSYMLKKISIFRRITMSLSDLKDYYRQQRYIRFEQGKKLKYIQLRETLYPLFVKFLVLDRIFRKQTITVLGNQRKYKGPVIYACTHIGENDLENIYEVIRRGCWWFVGDPCVLYKSISGLLLYLNGSIFLETTDKNDRRIAYLRAVELLKGGGSLMIFPEGTRNGTENLPVMELFPGTAKMAMESTWNLHPYKPMLPIKVGAAHLAAVLEVPIVPVIYEYVEVPYLCTKESEIYSKCIVKFGEPIYISRTESLILQTDRIQLAMEKIRIDLWDELGIARLSLADVNSSLYGNHTWLRKFGTSAEFDSRREMQFILSKNGQPIENEFCFDNNRNLIPGIIEKSEKEKYVGTKVG